MFNILRNIFGAVGIVFTVVGLGLLAFIILMRYSDQYYIDKKVESPKGEFVATLFANTGPGYCMSMVTVTPSSIPVTPPKKPRGGKYTVFESSCNENINLIWKSNYDLLIDISALEFNHVLNPVSIKSTDFSKKVSITYFHESLFPGERSWKREGQESRDSS